MLADDDRHHRPPLRHVHLQDSRQSRDTGLPIEMDQSDDDLIVFYNFELQADSTSGTTTSRNPSIDWINFSDGTHQRVVLSDQERGWVQHRVPNPQLREGVSPPRVHQGCPMPINRYRSAAGSKLIRLSYRGRRLGHNFVAIANVAIRNKSATRSSLRELRPCQEKVRGT